MARVFSVTESARLLGVSAATVSRIIPRGRTRRGKRANLSLEEVVEMASRVQADPEAVRRRAAGPDEFGPTMPAEAPAWAAIADQLDLMDGLARHVDHIPAGIAGRAGVEPEPFPIPRSSPETGDWQRLTPDLLDKLLPPGRA